jgi:hypothetical protein
MKYKNKETVRQKKKKRTSDEMKKLDIIKLKPLK